MTENTNEQTTALIAPNEKERIFGKVLDRALGSNAQIVEEWIKNHARNSGLQSILEPEIKSFLDYFYGAHVWRKRYVSTRFANLKIELEKSPAEERTIKIMEFAEAMSRIIKSSFHSDEDRYRNAMVGLGRIVEVCLTWQSDLKSSNIPRFSGIKSSGDPVAFLQRHYARWIADGRLSQVTLRKADEKLLNALKYELRKRGKSLSDLVPPGIRR